LSDEFRLQKSRYAENDEKWTAVTSIRDAASFSVVYLDENKGACSDVNKDLGLKAKAKDPKYQLQIFHRSSPYSVHHFFIVNGV